MQSGWLGNEIAGLINSEIAAPLTREARRFDWLCVRQITPLALAVTGHLEAHYANWHQAPTRLSHTTFAAHVFNHTAVAGLPTAFAFVSRQPAPALAVPIYFITAMRNGTPYLRRLITQLQECATATGRFLHLTVTDFASWDDDVS